MYWNDYFIRLDNDIPVVSPDILPIPSQYWQDRMFFKVGETDLPSGYKLHVSAKPETAQTISNVIIPYLLQKRVAFKIMGPLSRIQKIQSEGDIQGGKFITIYPNSLQDAVNTAKMIDYLLNTNGLNNPDQFYPVIGDFKLGETGGLYVRYGVFNPNAVPDEYWEFQRLILPDGRAVVENKRFPIHPELNKSPYIWPPTANPFSPLNATWISPTGRRYDWMGYVLGMETEEYEWDFWSWTSTS